MDTAAAAEETTKMITTAAVPAVAAQGVAVVDPTRNPDPVPQSAVIAAAAATETVKITARVGKKRNERDPARAHRHRHGHVQPHDHALRLLQQILARRKRSKVDKVVHPVQTNRCLVQTLTRTCSKMLLSRNLKTF